MALLGTAEVVGSAGAGTSRGPGREVGTMRTLIPVALGNRWKDSQWSGGRSTLKDVCWRLMTAER